MALVAGCLSARCVTSFTRYRGPIAAHKAVSIIMEKATNSDCVKLECCLEGIESAIQAVQGGAHRMELCANLNQGGVTPSIGDIEEAVSAVKGSGTAVHVLIRPRPGDFVYSEREKKVMAKDVAAAVKAGAHGVVIGALLEKGGIDEEITAELIRVARATAAPCSCSITFHRAFDCCATGATAALETLIRLGVDRVLTSGRAESAWAGRDTIARLVEAGQERIVVIPGAGVSRTNVKQLLIHTGAKEVHVGSGCHENIPWGSPRESSVSLGPSEGPSAVVRRVSRRLVSEILDTLA